MLLGVVRVQQRTRQLEVWAARVPETFLLRAPISRTRRCGRYHRHHWAVGLRPLPAVMLTLIPGPMAKTILSPSDGAPGDLQIRLLGRFTVAVQGRELTGDDWPSLRATHLVQLLSLQPGRQWARELVIDTLHERRTLALGPCHPAQVASVDVR